MEKLLRTGLFDGDATSNAAGWLQIIQGQASEGDEEAMAAEGTTTTRRKKGDTSLEAIGFVNFVYRRRTPFHPKRLHDFLSTHFVFYELVGEDDDDDEEAGADDIPAGTDATTKLEHRRSRAVGRVPPSERGAARRVDLEERPARLVRRVEVRDLRHGLEPLAQRARLPVEERRVLRVAVEGQDLELPRHLRHDAFRRWVSLGAHT